MRRTAGPERNRARRFTFSPAMHSCLVGFFVLVVVGFVAFGFCWHPGFLHDICHRASSFSRPQTFRWLSEPWSAHGSSSKKSVVCLFVCGCFGWLLFSCLVLLGSANLVTRPLSPPMTLCQDSQDCRNRHDERSNKMLLWYLVSF